MILKHQQTVGFENPLATRQSSDFRTLNVKLNDDSSDRRVDELSSDVVKSYRDDLQRPSAACIATLVQSSHARPSVIKLVRHHNDAFPADVPDCSVQTRERIAVQARRVG